MVKNKTNYDEQIAASVPVADSTPETVNDTTPAPIPPTEEPTTPAPSTGTDEPGTNPPVLKTLKIHANVANGATSIFDTDGKKYEFVPGEVMQITYPDPNNRIIYIKYSDQYGSNVANITYVNNYDVEVELNKNLTKEDDKNRYKFVVPNDVDEINIEFVLFSTNVNVSTSVQFVAITNDGKEINDTVYFDWGDKTYFFTGTSNMYEISLNAPIDTSTVAIGLIKKPHIENNNTYFCSYIYNPRQWNYCSSYVDGGKQIEVPKETPNKVIMFFDKTNWIVEQTLVPKLYIATNYDSTSPISITYSSANSGVFPVTVSSPQPWTIKPAEDNSFILKDFPKYWTGFENGPKDFTATISHNKPFRITSDKDGNNIIIDVNTKYENGAYTATWTIPWKQQNNSPYYGISTAYFVTKQFNKTASFKNNNTSNTIELDYKKNSETKIYKQEIPKGVWGTIYVENVISNDLSIKIDDIKYSGSNGNNYFCPYIIDFRSSEKYFCYQDNGWGGIHKLNTTRMFNIDKMIKKSDNLTFSPKMIVPVSIINGVKNPISVTYNYITNTYNDLSKNNKYTFSYNTNTLDAPDSSSDIGYWATYGFNVEGMDYKLVLQYNNTNSPNPSKQFTTDFDLYLGQKRLIYDNSSDGKYHYTIKPSTTDYKYFEGTPDRFIIYPKNRIKYQIDSSFFNNSFDTVNPLALNITILTDIVDDDKYTATYNISGNTDQKSAYAYTDYISSIHNIRYGFNIPSNNTKNPIKGIKTKWEVYNGEITESGERIINGTSLDSVDFKAPFTWNDISMSYTFSLVTESPGTVVTKYDLGLNLNTANIPTGCILYLDNDNYEIINVNDSSTTDGISSNKKMYQIPENSINCILLINKKESGIPTNTLNFQLYNTNTSYYITQNNINVTFNYSSSNYYERAGSLNINNYIAYNEFKRGKNIIKFEPIGIKYTSSVSVLNKNNNISTSLQKVEVPAITQQILEIPDEYVDDNTTYSLVINEISAEINGKTVNIPRYSFNLIEGGEIISYLKYKPIGIENTGDNPLVKIHNGYNERGEMVIDSTGIIIPPSLSPMAYIYCSSYINKVKLNANKETSPIIEFYEGGSTQMAPSIEHDINFGKYIKSIKFQ